jgi:hypothetical protein
MKTTTVNPDVKTFGRRCQLLILKPMLSKRINPDVFQRSLSFFSVVNISVRYGLIYFF